MHVNPSDRFQNQDGNCQSEDLSNPPVSIAEPLPDAAGAARKNRFCRCLSSAGHSAVWPFRRIGLVLTRRWCREELKIYLRRLSDAELYSLGITRREIDSAVKAAFPSPTLFGRAAKQNPAAGPILDGVKLLKDAAGRDVPGGKTPRR